MPYLRTKYILDTDVYIKRTAIGKEVTDAGWASFERRLRDERGKVLASYITMKELFIRLANSSPDYYEANKAPLVLLSSHARIYLENPPQFAIKKILGIDTAPVGQRRIQDEWPEVIQTLLASASIAQACDGVRIGRELRSFDFEHFKRIENWPQERYGEILTRVRPEPIPDDARAIISRNLLEDCELKVTKRRLDLLQHNLDAFLEMQMWLRKQRSNLNYNYEAPNHLTDWGDTMQLMYLADPSVRLITCNRKILDRTRSSSQSHQILIWPDEFEIRPG